MDVFEKIANRRRNLERYIPITLALGIATFYSYFRANDELTIKVVGIFWFSSIIIVHFLALNIFGFGTKKTEYKPKPNYLQTAIYACVLIILIVLINLLYQ